MGFATADRQSMLNWLFRATAMPTTPTTIYASLLKTAPSAEDGTGLAEMTTSDITGYARKAIAFGAPGANGTAQEVSNSASIDFGVAAANITIVGVAFYDASTAGTYHGWSALTGGNLSSGTQQSVTSGTDVTVAVGAVKWDV